jgi:hypothetical protein
MKYIVRSMVVIETVVELDSEQDDVYFWASDEAGKQIQQVLAGLDFDFCEDTQVFDQEGNELEEEE